MKRRAPIKHPISFWNMHVDAWRLSGLSQKEYCRRHGLRDTWLPQKIDMQIVEALKNTHIKL